MAPKISVAINTLNEETRLPLALRSVTPWADEVVVVDMHSDDRTAEIARSFGAHVHLHERAHFAEPARAFALAQCTGDWVLSLDADELIPAPLSVRLRAIAARDEADAVRIPRLNYLLGEPVRHSGWGPDQDRHLRFFRRGRLAPPSRLHGPASPAPGARVLDLRFAPGQAIVHFNYLDVSDFLERLNRYTTIEAQTARARGQHSGTGRALLHAGRELAKRYLEFAGFRDGWRGAYLAWFMAFYRLATAAKLRELEAGVTRGEVEARYREAAEALLLDYPPPQAHVGEGMRG